MNNFKNNSMKAKREEENDIHPKIIADVEIKEDSSFKKKIASAFFKEDRESISGFIFEDVIIPMLKEGIMTAITGTLSMIFYGDNTHANTKGNYDYNKKYTNSTTRRRYEEPETTAPKNRLETSNIIFKSRSEAINVLNYLKDRIDEYERATLGDFYECVGVSSTFTDNSYGWYSLDGVYVAQAKGGYILVLPKAKYFNR